MEVALQEMQVARVAGSAGSSRAPSVERKLSLRLAVEVDVPVEVGGAGTKALIDTGAPRCVFPRGIGDLVWLTFPI